MAAELPPVNLGQLISSQSEGSQPDLSIYYPPPPAQLTKFQVLSGTGKKVSFLHKISFSTLSISHWSDFSQRRQMSGNWGLFLRLSLMSMLALLRSWLPCSVARRIFLTRIFDPLHLMRRKTVSQFLPSFGFLPQNSNERRSYHCVTQNAGALE